MDAMFNRKINYAIVSVNSKIIDQSKIDSTLQLNYEHSKINDSTITIKFKL